VEVRGQDGRMRRNVLVDGNRVAEADDGISVPLESTEDTSPEILEEKLERRSELLHPRRSILPPHQFLGEVPILQYAVVVDGGRNQKQRRGEIRIACRRDDVVEHPQL